MVRKNLALVWRRIPQRYRLQGSICRNCSEKFFPPRDFCPKCRRKGKIEPFIFSGKGTILSYTEVTVPPNGYELYAPYVLAIIGLEEGPMITGQIADSDKSEIKKGVKVRSAFRILKVDGDEGLIHYGYKFVVDK